jgi:hypothetical protein
MNQQRDIERLLDHWFSEGLDQAPDRVVDIVTDRIERQSQRPAWRLQWRPSPVNAYAKFAVAAAAVLLVAIVGYNLLPAGSRIGGPGPTPSPTPTASLTPSAPPLNGSLKAGDYVARALPGDPMTYTVTVPDGWAGYDGWAMEGPHTNSAPSGIGIAFLHDPQVAVTPCDSSGKGPSPAPTARSVDDLVAALSARTDLRVSGTADTEVGGRPGKRLDLQLPAQPSCDPYYVFAEPQGFYAQGPANLWRVWVVDAAGGPAVITIEYFAGTSAADLATAQAIVDSTRITP